MGSTSRDFTYVTSSGFFLLILTYLVATSLQAQHLNRQAGSMFLVKDFSDSTRVRTDNVAYQLSEGVLYDADQPALHRTAVKIQTGEGASGSGAVISDEGLILTSHFVALKALSQLSTPERNLIKNGYSAQNKREEIPLHNYSILVPLQQRNITEWVTRRIPDQANYGDSIRTQRKLHRKLKQEYNAKAADRHVRIKSIYGGNQQLLVTYRRISDVRLVQVPPAIVAQYKGTASYHRWPRYSGGYALLRGYVAPDGSSRPYQKSNVPWKPERSLTIDAGGLQPDTPSIVLSYPRTTYRLHSSYAYEYYQQDLNPYIRKSLVDILDGLERAATGDPAIALSNQYKRSNMHRSLTYYREVRNGFQKYNILQKKKALEDDFKYWVSRDSLRNHTYSRVLRELEKSYRIAAQNAPILYTSLYTINHNKVMQIARLYDSYFDYIRHPDSLKFSSRKRQSTLKRHKRILNHADIDAQMEMLADLLVNFYELPDRNQLPFFYLVFNGSSKSQFRSSVEAFLERQRKKSVVFDPGRAKKLLQMEPEKVKQTVSDSLIKLFDSINNGFQVGRKNHRRHYPYLRPAQRYYVKGIHQMQKQLFQRPDANETLRISPGMVKDRRLKTGETKQMPYTTLDEWINNANQKDRTLPKPFRNWNQRYQENGSLQLPDSNLSIQGTNRGFPLTALTTHDITNGSSGGAIINKEGNLAGITLEVNKAGIIGDFYPLTNTKRAIGIDARFLLMLIDYYDRQNYILSTLSIDH